MEGAPETLQLTFETAMSEAGLNRFLSRLTKALGLLTSKLYGNTSEVTSVAPYQQFGLQMPEQPEWLVENAGFILQYYREETGTSFTIDPNGIATMLRVIASNDGSVESEVCLAHGDLNFQNVICDSSENVWFIDWTHSGEHPLEMDFTKMENDVKFVMTKELALEDLPHLKQFEEYLVKNRVPAKPDELPQELQFARWDLRFRKMLESIRCIRRACLDLKRQDDWLVYRVGLLRYALHTLSFDKRRARGECEVVQLMHALVASEALVYDLIADDFHLQIPSERPASYPARQQIPIEQAPWPWDCAEYAPPYHVDASILDAPWAEPEDVTEIAESLAERARQHDAQGRPLNPRGRTGIAGRGLLGRWGPNPAVVVIVTRRDSDAGTTDILVGRKVGQHSLSLPKGFVLPDESSHDALLRVLEEETMWRPPSADGALLHDGYTYDARQTDHAWVTVQAWHLPMDDADVPPLFRPDSQFDELGWLPLTKYTLSDLLPTHATFVRMAQSRMETPATSGAGS